MKRLIVFHATWCAPCHRYKPTVDYVQQATEVEVTRVDIDQEPELVAEYGVQMVPTTIVLESERETARAAGPIEVSDLLALLDHH